MDEYLAKQRMLVIAPHSDDEVFGCGGTMARTKAAGGEVFVICCSVADLRQYTKDGREQLVTAETRAEEFGAAMEYLGVDDYEIIFTDNERHLRLDAIPRRDLIALFERECRLSIDRIRPTIIALPAISYNQDHEAVFKAGFTACRPQLRSVKPFQQCVLAYDNPAISWSLEREKFHPNFYIDITDYLDKKLEAVRLHASQAKPASHHASVENIETLARIRGAEISAPAAEAFMCYRFVV